MKINIVFIFLICTIATTLGAISGIGGGVIIKPVMDAASGFSVSTISFLSGCTVLSMSVISLLKSRKDKIEIDIKRVSFLAIGAALGGVLGKIVFDYSKILLGNDNAIGSIQSLIMIILTLGVLIYIVNKSNIKVLSVENLLACFLIGVVLGIISSFLGIGGGPINLVVLYFFFSMNTKTAAFNSIYIILFSQTSSFLITVLKGDIPHFKIEVLLCMVSGGIIGGFVGRSISKKLSEQQTDKLFVVIIVSIIIICVFNFIKYLG